MEISDVPKLLKEEHLVGVALWAIHSSEPPSTIARSSHPRRNGIWGVVRVGEGNHHRCLFGWLPSALPLADVEEDIVV
jgi:hypothetical protein